jgi:hypothetical protein
MSFTGQINFGYPITSQNIITNVPDNAVLPLSLGSSLQGNILGVTFGDLKSQVSTPWPAFIQYDEINKTLWNTGYSNDSSCVSYGEYALDGATGSSNTGIGAFALFNNTWSYNTAVGDQALKSSSGQQNVAIGYQALNNSQASFCVGIGHQALGGIGATNQGTRNTGIGTEALGFVTTGNFNTATGSGSLFNVTTGTSNTGFGQGAGANISVGSNNTFIGAFSSADAVGISGSVVIGRDARTTANNQFVIGSTAYNAGTVTTETVSSTRTWTVRINGVDRKILLA